ncbi:MAG: hypothetical protein AAF882_10510 [Pseudomonadota bacterium]
MKAVNTSSLDSNEVLGMLGGTTMPQARVSPPQIGENAETEYIGRQISDRVAVIGRIDPNVDLPLRGGNEHGLAEPCGFKGGADRSDRRLHGCDGERRLPSRDVEEDGAVPCFDRPLSALV